MKKKGKQSRLQGFSFVERNSGIFLGFGLIKAPWIKYNFII